MSEEIRNLFTGSTIDERIAGNLYELKDIGIGLTHIVNQGRYGFGLEGKDLNDFIRRCLYLLLEHGAGVRHTGSPSQPYREIELHYGNDTHEEIVEGVIADWIAGGAGDLEWGDFWFAIPGTYWPAKKT